MSLLSILNSPSNAFWIETGNHFWQSTLFGLFIALVIVFFKKGNAITRYIIGWVGLIKFILPSSLLFLIFIDLKPAPNYETPSEIESLSPLNIKLTEPFILINQPGTFLEEEAIEKRSNPIIGLSILDIIGIIWLVVAFLIFARWQYVLYRFIWEIRKNSQSFPDSLNRKLHELSNRIGLKKKVRGYLLNNNIEPGSFGLFSPKLILPADLIQELTSKELELVLLHELIHIKHRDNLWSFLQKVFFCLLWFNPFIWWLNRRLMWESEKKCDESVLSFSEGNSTYAKSILTVTRYCIGRNIMGYSGMSDIDLESRMKNIIEYKRNRFSWNVLPQLLIVMVVISLFLITAASGFLTHRVKPTVINFEAYSQYSLGRTDWMQRKIWTLEYQKNEDRLKAAIEHFEQAIALNPKQALAYAGLADVYRISPARLLGIERSEKKALVEETANKALALNPNLAEARASMGSIKERYYKDFRGAEKEFERAIELNPKYAPAHQRYAELLFYKLGRLEEALAEARAAVDLEPLEPYYNRYLGTMLFYARQYNAAIEQFQRVLEIDPNYSDVWIWFTITYIFQEEFDNAINTNIRFAELTGGDPELAGLWASLVAEHARTGEPVTPPPELEEYFAKWGWTTYLYAYLGHKEKTIELLEERPDALGRLKYYPAFDFIRSEPRFIEVLQESKARNTGNS